MNEKHRKIKLLKDKIINMQCQLDELQRKQQEQQLLHKKNQQIPSSNKQRRTSTNLQYKSPTFWGQSPIQPDKRGSKAGSPRHQVRRYNMHDSLESSLSPKVRKMSNSIDKQFYVHEPLKQCDSNNQEKQKFYKTSFIGKRYLQKETPEKTPRFDSGKKIFNKKKTSVILNPQKQKSIGKKIIGKPERSSNLEFVENPKSNQNLYFCLSKPMMLEKKKKNSINQKNYSTVEIVEKVPVSLKSLLKTQKKHYARYFYQNLCSNVD